MYTGPKIVTDGLLRGYDADRADRFYTPPPSAELNDLVGGADFSLANVSYDVNDDIVYDGVDDYITIGYSTYPATWDDAYAAEVVMMVPSDAHWANAYYSNIVGKGSYGGSLALNKAPTDNVIANYLRHDGGTVATTYTITRDQHYHAVATWSKPDLKLYVNGVLRAAKTIASPTGVPDKENWNAGYRRAFGGNWGLWYEGYLPVVKVYNKELSEEQVYNNYLAYKQRFGI